MYRLALLLVAWIVLPPSGFAQTPTFKFVRLDFPGAAETSANGVNNAGVIVGSYVLNGHTHGFKLSNGRFTTIDIKGAQITTVSAINDKGDLAGTFATNDLKSHGFILHGGAFTRLDFPGAVNGTVANGINNSLTVVGTVDDVAGFIWSAGKSHKFLAPSDIGGATTLNGISNLGRVVGDVFFSDFQRPFMFQGSDFDFLRPAGSLDLFVNGVNGRGDVVGCPVGTGSFLAFNPEAGESSSDKPDRFPALHTFKFPGASSTCANGINFSRAIVGSYSDSLSHRHGFLAIVQ
jgi:uncharacterized membrane protein